MAALLASAAACRGGGAGEPPLHPPSISNCGNGVLCDGTRYVSVGVSTCRSP
jgi:hypothetical protein